MKIIAGGEDIAVLNKDGSFLDSSIDKAYENFTTYQEGNENGRFFFVRNVEEEDKPVVIKVPEELNGREYIFTTTIKASQTRIFPVAFKIPGTDVKLEYSISEIWLTHKYDKETAVVMYGTDGTQGEICLNLPTEQIVTVAGDIKKYDIGSGSSIVSYVHSKGNIIIIKAADVRFFILDESMIGRVETLKDGLLFHNAYYLENVSEEENIISLKAQVKENTNNCFEFYPVNEGTAFKQTLASLKTSEFTNRPAINWTSGWKYRADSEEINAAFDDSAWKYLENPVSLEEADLFKHGYYWYRAQFEADDDMEEGYLYYKHNDTDRYLLYINGELVFRSRNKSIDRHNITHVLKKGTNTIAILYANEFHNKSHPHEGALVKLSGIMNPLEIIGKYKNGEAAGITIKSFRVNYQLSGYNAGFHTLEYNDNDWQTALDVKKLVVGKEMGHVVWFRRHFTYNPEEGYLAPLQIVPIKADERLLIYVNGKSVAQYDIIGPQEEFYIPDCYLNDGDNVISMVLECPGFFEEIMSGYRRGYMYSPVVRPSYVAKKVEIVIK